MQKLKNNEARPKFTGSYKEEKSVYSKNNQSSCLLCFNFPKVDHLIATLEALREKDPMIKSLVVSQFTSFLDIIEIPLEKNGFQFVRLDGTMAQERRAEAIEVFSDPSPSSPTVFLLSLTAGGVGLNLTAATQIFLMDPVSWNKVQLFINLNTSSVIIAMLLCNFWKKLGHKNNLIEKVVLICLGEMNP